MAFVYLYPANIKLSKLNFLQEMSTIIKDKAQEQPDEGVHNVDDQSQKLDLKMISGVLKGLETYKNPTKQKVIEYAESLDPIVSKNNFFFLVIYLFCFLSNFIIVSSRQDAPIVYSLLKQVELFTFADVPDDIIAYVLNPKNNTLNPSTSSTVEYIPTDKVELWEYFTQRLPYLMFYPALYYTNANYTPGIEICLLQKDLDIIG